MDPNNLVREFVTKFERPIGLSENTFRLAANLIVEEAGEVEVEFWKPFQSQYFTLEDVNKISLTEELADLQYVINYAAVVLELPLNEVFEEKHRANMTKLGDDGKPILREDGKILKGPNYVKPDYSRFFQSEGAS